MKKESWFYCIILCCSCLLDVTSQTIGLMLQTEASADGHVLFAPNASRTVYLIDNCGYELNSWVTDHTPGLSVYLMENGDLLKTARIPSTFNGGGSGGRVERRSWDNDLLWSYNFSNTTYHQHHDIEPMPNGNLLLIAWEKIETADLQTSGRNSISNAGLWSTYILEIKPIGTDDMEIVWEWRAWDHLIQDVDSTFDNFGVIAEHPERIDVNLDPGQSADWLHTNGIDYNEDLDQIVISVHDVDEIYVIDHSTTTEEAKGSVGGLYGKGGDLLYRWGNPENYGRGTDSERLLFGQHDVTWIENGYPGAGSFLVFNNGAGRPGATQFSTVEVWLPEQDSMGFYHLEEGMPFGPSAVDWLVGEGDVTFYSSRISGAQRLENGNTLICSGRSGQMLEVDSLGTLVWEYINPVANNPLTQGTQPFATDLFRTTKYPLDYGAFIGRDLVPGDPIELQPLPYECELYLSNDNLSQQKLAVSIFPNPAFDVLNLSTIDEGLYDYSIIGMQGKTLANGNLEYDTSINLDQFTQGLYHLLLFDKNKTVVHASSFVVN